MRKNGDKDEDSEVTGQVARELLKSLEKVKKEGTAADTNKAVDDAVRNLLNINANAGQPAGAAGTGNIALQMAALQQTLNQIQGPETRVRSSPRRHGAWAVGRRRPMA